MDNRNALYNQSLTFDHMFRRILSKFNGYYPALGGLIVFILSFVLRKFPETMHQVYRNQFFAVYRWIHDGIFGYIPFPLIYIIVLVGGAVGIYIFFKRRGFYRPWYRSLANTIGIILIWFYVAWGYNYSATDVKTALNLQPQKLSEEEREHLLTTSIQFAQAARMLSDTSLFFGAESEIKLPAIHSSVREELRRVGFETPGNVTLRRISETGWLRRMGISGIYLPFSGEAHADASYLPLRSWFIMAHEYVHGYGITTEGECDYIAFMALKNSGVPELEYAAWFEMINSVRPPIVDTLAYATLPEFFRNDHGVLRENNLAFQPWFGQTANMTNDLYLKLNGIEEGIESYNLLPSYFIASGRSEVSK